jgi:hypothetical protein
MGRTPMMSGDQLRVLLEAHGGDYDAAGKAIGITALALILRLHRSDRRQHRKELRVVAKTESAPRPVSVAMPMELRDTPLLLENMRLQDALAAAHVACGRQVAEAQLAQAAAERERDKANAMVETLTREMTAVARELGATA